MRSSIRNIILSLLIGGFFLWLAIRNVPLDTLLGYLGQISYGWIIPYTIIALFTNYLRAERWRLLIHQGIKKPLRGTIFTGVMLGYLVNYAIPRLGEISRCIYVAKKEKLSGTNLVGTVILERVIDMAVMLALSGVVALFIISDAQILAQLFGDDTIVYLRSLMQIQSLLIITGVILVVLVVGFYSIRVITQSRSNKPGIEKIIQYVKKLIITFTEGLLSIKHVRHWPYFVCLTALIWFGYVVLAYIPFTVFNLHAEYGLNIIDALVIMIIASIGVALPSPGGIGTYHWFVRQGLLVLYGVPVSIGLAYAFVSHAVMMGVIIFSTPVIMIWNNWFINRKSS